eukprot:scaffold6273_cov136-Skeletonema_marinoi.AAC.3
MVTLIRTFKRITPPPIKPNEKPETKTAATIGIGPYPDDLATQVRKFHNRIKTKIITYIQMTKSYLVKEIAATGRRLGHVPQRATGMGKGSAYVAVKDALIKLKKEECVLGMVRRFTSTYPSAKDVQIKPYKEECVLDTLFSTITTRLEDTVLRRNERVRYRPPRTPSTSDTGYRYQYQ